MKINQSVSSSPQTQTHRLLEVEVDGEHHEGVGAAGAQDHHMLHIAVNRDEAPAAQNTPIKGHTHQLINRVPNITYLQHTRGSRPRI